jgi:hypothetical protein
MINGRNKGARGEREIITILQRTVDSVLGDAAFTLKRNLEQTRDGGADIAGASAVYDIVSFEIKRQERLLLNTWWKQTLKQARNSERLPVLIYKQSRGKWTVVMLGHAYRNKKVIKITITLDDFLDWYKQKLTTIKECENG